MTCRLCDGIPTDSLKIIIFAFLTSKPSLLYIGTAETVFVLLHFSLYVGTK